MTTSNKAPSIRDIAKQCGVSPGTVSNVINGRDIVKPETAKRVRALMNELNYLPQSKAVNTNRVMLLLPPHHDALLNAHTSSLHAGICEAAFNANIVLSMQRCPRDLKSANQLRDMLREDGSAGVILMTSADGYHLADTLALTQTPHIVVGASRHHENINQIVFDDETSAYQATRYLQSLGHKRISMIYFNRKDIGHAQRYVGFAAASKKLKMNKALLNGQEVNHAQPQQGADAFERLMKLPTLPTAIIVTNSSLTHGVLSKASEMGIKIPDDLSLITYQSSPMLDCGLQNITAMKTPAYEMGMQAVDSMRQLLLKIKNQPTSPITVQMTHTLEVRQSTASPKQD